MNPATINNEKMKKAIKCIEERIHKINIRLSDLDLIEPEMNSDLIFIQSETENLTSEREELQGAIKILNGKIHPQKAK